MRHDIHVVFPRSTATDIATNRENRIRCEHPCGCVDIALSDAT